MNPQDTDAAIKRGQQVADTIAIESARLHGAAIALFDVGGLPVVDAVMREVHDRLERLPAGVRV